MRRLVPVLAGLLILTGCEQTAPMRIEPGWASCADAIPDTTKAMSSDSLDLPPLDDGFTPTAAVVCATAFEMDPDFSQRNFLTEGRTDDIAGLLAALRLPSEHRWGACTAIDHIIPFVVLLDADNRWVRPGTPSDSCGTIREEVRDAVTALKLTPVSKRLIREDLSSGAGKATCAEHWADMVWVRTTTQTGGPNWSTPGTPPLRDGDEVRLCVYTVADSTRGSLMPTGDLDHDGVLTARQWRPIAAKLGAAGPAPTCDAPATRFALLRRADNTGGDTYVELDGCRRVMSQPADGPPRISTAGEDLIALIAAAR
ncbi:hypothetical protein GCM10009682_21530 [Luedemannella flava]|uniref:Lipoprotein n=1 Tax=Luedemannella flava TaxID=349316 RepID=A0ABN2LX46_9ACTN